MKEGRLKRYRDKVKQFKRNRIFKNKERKLYLKVSEESTRTNK